mgnify:CR=1 FL=1
MMFLTAGSAHAFDVALVGQLEVTDPQFDPGLTGSTTAITPGGGLLLSHYFKSVVGIEVGALFTDYHLRVEDAGVTTDSSNRYLQIPFMLRIQPDPAFSFGGGYFIGSNMSGDDLTKSDSGLVFGGGSKIPIGKSKKFSFLIDARYLIGGTNLSEDSTRSLKVNHIQVLVGVSFTIGKGGK